MKATNTERTNRLGVALTMGVFESLGFAFREQSESDYGIDGHAELIREGEPTGQLLGIQIKTGGSYLSERNDTEIIFRTGAAHMDYWINHALPVIICLCDADNQTIYWQAVTKETAIPTGKGYKLHIPTKQILNTNSVQELAALLTPLVSPDRYTIFKTEDISHGLAKRYSFRVILNGTASKAEIASVVRKVTTEGEKRRYHRNHMIKGRWGDTDAHVIWTFVYPSVQDAASYNHICHSLWIADSLDKSARPLPLKGENIGGGIFVNWNDNYSFLAKHMSANTLTKEDYLNTVLPLINELSQLLDQLEEYLLSLKAENITEAKFLSVTEVCRTRINEIYTSITRMALAPFECKVMDESLQCLVVCMDNLALYFSREGRSTWSFNSRLQLAL